jgi:2-dehydropantoate 2-reductase
VTAPGHIKHAAVPPFIAFGELDKTKSPRVDELLKIFEGLTAVAVAVPDDIELAMWDKYLMICAYSGVGAVTRQPVGLFRTVPETRIMFRHTLEEVVAVANARGVMLSEQSIQGVMDRMDASQPDVMASMQKDILEGRPSELDAQIGALIRMAHMADLSVPTNEFIYASLLPLELKARGM